MRTPENQQGSESIPTMKSLREWKEHISRTFFGYGGIDIEYFFQCVDGPLDKTVVHIPARSGSTRNPDKNNAEISHAPLLAYTIRVALALGVDRVIVNTDSRKYAEIAERHGAEVPFLRPEILNRNDVSPGLATYYLERYLLSQGYPLGTIVDMYPTSPFRNVATIRKYLQAVAKAGFCATALLPDFDLRGLHNGQGPIRVTGGPGMDSSIIHFKVMANFLGRKIVASEKCWFHYELIDNPVELIDIDTPADLALAEFIVENGLYDFGVEI